MPVFFAVNNNKQPVESGDELPMEMGKRLDATADPANNNNTTVEMDIENEMDLDNNNNTSSKIGKTSPAVAAIAQ